MVPMRMTIAALAKIGKTRRVPLDREFASTNQIRSMAVRRFRTAESQFTEDGDVFHLAVAHRQLSYQELAFHLEDSASFRAFARLPWSWCP